MFPGLDESILKIFNFLASEGSNVEIFIFPGLNESILKNFNFFGLRTVRFDNLDVLGPRQANFEKFIFFYLEMFFFIILIFPGLDEPILKIFNYLALERLF